MSLKSLIFFGLLSVALGFTLPDENTDANGESGWVFGEVLPVSDDLVLLRKARSPEVSMNPETGNIDYKQEISKNLEGSAGASPIDKSVKASLAYSDPTSATSGIVTYSRPAGPSVSISSNRQITKNLDGFVEASRNFKHNENSGQTGLTYSMPSSSVSGSAAYSPPSGSSATIGYNRQITPDLNAFAGATRNFRFNENSGHAGLTYSMPQKQSSITSKFEYSPPMGRSASFDYNHQFSKNLDAYAGVSRNFRFNDNSGHIGLRYRPSW